MSTYVDVRSQNSQSKRKEIQIIKEAKISVRKFEYGILI
jgi:hypothetical protein